jgi:hypothetical protein
MGVATTWNPRALSLAPPITFFGEALRHLREKEQSKGSTLSIIVIDERIHDPSREHLR